MIRRDQHRQKLSILSNDSKQIHPKGKKGIEGKVILAQSYAFLSRQHTFLRQRDR